MEIQERPTENQQRTGRSLRGFASMDREKQRAIASKGGRAAHEKGTAHEFNSDEASIAAKRGHERGTAHEFTPEEARVAGRKGGLARAINRGVNGKTGGTDTTTAPSISSQHHNPGEQVMPTSARETSESQG